MKRSKKMLVSLALIGCMLFGTAGSAVAYAQEVYEVQTRMLYISNYGVYLSIESNGIANVSASLAGKCAANSSSIMLILQRMVGDSWANCGSWYETSDDEYVAIAEQCKVSPGTYRCVATFSITTDSGTETKNAQTVARTYSE